MKEMMKSDIPGLEEDEAMVYKWKVGMYGNFFALLWGAMTKADPTNLAKIAKGFPKEVAALERFHTENGWWDKIEAKTRGFHQALQEG